MGKNQESEPEPLEKKSVAGAGARADKKFAGSPALLKSNSSFHEIYWRGSCVIRHQFFKPFAFHFNVTGGLPKQKRYPIQKLIELS